MPARSISRWLAISASEGTSLTVARWNWDRRMRIRKGSTGPAIVAALHKAAKRGSHPVPASAGFLAIHRDCALRRGEPLGALFVRKRLAARGVGERPVALQQLERGPFLIADALALVLPLDRRNRHGAVAGSPLGRFGRRIGGRAFRAGEAHALRCLSILAGRRVGVVDDALVVGPLVQLRRRSGRAGEQHGNGGDG